MYLLFRFESAAQLQHMTDLGRFMEYVIAYAPADVESLIDIGKLDAVVLTEDVAKALPYLYVGWKGTVKLKLGSVANALKLHTDIFSSLEDINQPDNVAIYPINDTEVANTVTLGKAILRKKLELYYVEKFKQLSLGVDVLESATWEQQKAEAVAYTADNTATVPMLAALATARGITTAEMVALVNSAVSSYNTAITTLLAGRQAIEKEIKALATIASINKILHTRFGTSMSEAQKTVEGISDPATINL